METKMKRREFLKTMAFSTSGLLFLTGNGWAAKALGEEKTRKRLVVVFLRGAVDGLNVVVPYSETVYYSARPTIAIPRPGGASAAGTIVAPCPRAYCSDQ